MNNPASAPYLDQLEVKTAHTRRILEIINTELALRTSPNCIQRRLAERNLMRRITHKRSEQMYIQPLDDSQKVQSLAMQVYNHVSEEAALRGAQRQHGISK